MRRLPLLTQSSILALGVGLASVGGAGTAMAGCDILWVFDCRPDAKLTTSPVATAPAAPKAGGGATMDQINAAASNLKALVVTGVMTQSDADKASVNLAGTNWSSIVAGGGDVVAAMTKAAIAQANGQKAVDPKIAAALVTSGPVTSDGKGNFSGGSVTDRASAQIKYNGSLAVGLAAAAGQSGNTKLLADLSDYVSKGGVVVATAGGGTLMAGAAALIAKDALPTQAGLITNDGGSLLGKTSAGLIGENSSGLLKSNAGVVSNDGGSLLGKTGAGLITNDGGSLVGKTGAGLITNDGGSLVGKTGAGVVSNDGGSLLGKTGAGVVSNDGGSLLGKTGAGAIGENSSGLLKSNAGVVSSDGAGLITNDGGSLIGKTGAGAISDNGSGMRSLMSVDGGPAPAPKADGAAIVAKLNALLASTAPADLAAAAAGADPGLGTPAAGKRSLMSVEDKGNAVAALLGQTDATQKANVATTLVASDRQVLDTAIAQKDLSTVGQMQAKMAADTAAATAAIGAVAVTASNRTAVSALTSTIGAAQIAATTVQSELNAPVDNRTTAQKTAADAAAAVAAANAKTAVADADKVQQAALAFEAANKANPAKANAVDNTLAASGLASAKAQIVQAQADLKTMIAKNASSSDIKAQQDLIGSRLQNYEVVNARINDHYADVALAATSAVAGAAAAQTKLTNLTTFLGTDRPTDPTALATVNALMAEARLTQVQSDQAVATRDQLNMKVQVDAAKLMTSDLKSVGAGATQSAVDKQVAAGASYASDIQNKQAVIDSAKSQIAIIAPRVDPSLITDTAVETLVRGTVTAAQKTAAAAQGTAAATTLPAGPGGDFKQSSTTTIGGSFVDANGKTITTAAAPVSAPAAASTTAVPVRTLQSVDIPATTVVAAGALATGALQGLSPAQLTALAGAVPNLAKVSDSDIQVAIGAAKAGVLTNYLATRADLTADQRTEIATAGALLATLPSDQVTKVVSVVRSASTLPTDQVATYLTDVQSGMTLNDAAKVVQSAVAAKTATAAMSDLVTALGSRPADPDQLKQVNKAMSAAGVATYQSKYNDANATLTTLIANHASTSAINDQQQLVAAAKKNYDVTAALDKAGYYSVQVDAQVAASAAQTAQAKVDAMVKVIGTGTPTADQTASLNALKDAASLATVQSQKAGAVADVTRMTAQGQAPSDIKAKQAVVDASSKQIAVLSPTVAAESNLTTSAALMSIAQSKVVAAQASAPTLPGVTTQQATSASPSKGAGPIGGGAPPVLATTKAPTPAPGTMIVDGFIVDMATGKGIGKVTPAAPSTVAATAPSTTEPAKPVATAPGTASQPAKTVVTAIKAPDGGSLPKTGLPAPTPGKTGVATLPAPNVAPANGKGAAVKAAIAVVPAVLAKAAPAVVKAPVVAAPALAKASGPAPAPKAVVVRAATTPVAAPKVMVKAPVAAPPKVVVHAAPKAPPALPKAPLVRMVIKAAPPPPPKEIKKAPVAVVIPVKFPSAPLPGLKH